jgi:Leucine-rich repeat (LRR) protein
VFGFLRSPTCVLENLDLYENQLNDEAMDSLIDALANNRSLRSLDLAENRRVTGAGWQRFVFTILGNPSSGLEKLDLNGCDQLDNVAIRALTNDSLATGRPTNLEAARCLWMAKYNWMGC